MYALVNVLSTFQLSTLAQPISCDHLSDYCSTREVMIKMNNWLLAKLVTRLCLDWISGHLGDKREEISKFCTNLNSGRLSL